MIRMLALFSVSLSAILVLCPPLLAADGVTAQQVFDRLATLSGEWNGSAKGEGEAEAEGEHSVHHVFELSAANTVVMETMNPGGAHEMINMYHVDGDDLVMTHYCAGGNQPTMKVKLEESSLDHLVFEFTGGTNLDAATDNHIHDAAIHWNDDGTLLSTWRAFGNGEPVGNMEFTLSRQEG